MTPAAQKSRLSPWIEFPGFDLILVTVCSDFHSLVFMALIGCHKVDNALAKLVIVPISLQGL